jgi:hypothetical protein
MRGLASILAAAVHVSVACAVASPAARATEGAASYYFPGGFASFLVAVPPEPGFVVASQTFLFSGNASRAVIGGRANFGVSASAVYEYVGAFFAPDAPVLGGRLQSGAALPIVGSPRINVSLATRFGNVSAGDSDTGFGDLSLAPFALFWNFGDFNVKLAELVIAPTGRYDVNKLINVGRNYWAFDSQLGLTWFRKEMGTELSVLAGLMLNTVNPATDYKSGTEFHLDFMANQFLAPSLAVGVQGYWYRQVEGDSGSGAALGPFTGESVGIGPALLWLPEVLGGRAALIGKIQFDVSATNRLTGNWGQVTLSYRF